MPFTLPTLSAKWIALSLGVVALIAAIYFSISAYGNARYKAGVADTDAAWKAAAARLEAEGEASAEAADKNAKTREEQFTARLEQEKNDVQEAVRAGRDPFDVVFPVGVRD